MSRAIREHLRDFLAIIALVAGRACSRLRHPSQPGHALPAWVPFLGEDRFELKAEFTSAQAVTPGQGQAVDDRRDPGRRHHRGRARGRQRGRDDGGRQQVRGADQRRRLAAAAPEDRPQRHGDRGGPGQRDRDVEEGDTIPLATTQPNVNPDEFLASLDADTQAFLKLLLAGGAEASSEQGRGRKLSAPCAASSRSPATSPGSTAPLATAPRQHPPARSTTSACSPTSWATRTPT